MNTKVKKGLCKLFLGVVLLALYLPILMLVVYSFTDSSNIGAIRGFSIQNYVTLFTKPELTQMIGGTLFLAVGASVIATLLGTLGAVGAFYSGKLVKLAIGAVNEVPVVNADVVTGFSVCILLIGVFGVDKNTFVPLVVGHVVLLAPFVYLSVAPKLKQMDSSLYEAALDLGASPATALRKWYCRRLCREFGRGLCWRLRFPLMIILLQAIQNRQHLIRLVHMWSMRQKGHRRK